jgi:transcriptional regulator with GAF, ATPase, and Fis domain
VGRFTGPKQGSASSDEIRTKMNKKTVNSKANARWEDLDGQSALEAILMATSSETGEAFFTALVENLAGALDTHGCWVSEYQPEKCQLKSIAFLMGDQWISGYEYKIEGTPCEVSINASEFLHVPDRLMEMFPGDGDLANVGAVSYMGVPLMGVDGKVLGHMGVMDKRPMPEVRQSQALFHIFADRATAELQRLRAESEVRLREERLRGLVDGAMDAIVEFTTGWRITRVNPAAKTILRCGGSNKSCTDLTGFLDEQGIQHIQRLIREIESNESTGGSLWVPGGLRIIDGGHNEVQTEATLSRYEVGSQCFYTLILRNVDDRIAAQQKIQVLSDEAEYLRQQVRSLSEFDQIVGESEALLKVLRDIDQVADTDATVLILGETGTGKEVIARGIHDASKRKNGPMVKVNCAALPANLVESEFFGHAKGAFTGATEKRQGRFAIADGGTIFLDEIGDLPLDLQSKLLRVLQEGEFEPVGSSRTMKVNVRILAATNHDLEKAVADGKFRQDLYYRLNVFPIQIPPLRDRGDDVILLAQFFSRKLTERMGRPRSSLTEQDRGLLCSYDWPGNVRELENVIERALITASDGRLNLQRAMPGAGPMAGKSISDRNGEDTILTVEQFQGLERRNLIRALESCSWRVSGASGAASLLGMKPSTLSSRIKALGIKKAD